MEEESHTLFFFNDTATTEIYTLSLHDALPILVIFGAGAGMPYFSTDTVAAQRALEIECQVLLMGKNGVDGVYDDDPRTNPDAVMYDDLDYATVLAKQLKVADATAISLCMDNQMPIVVFNLLRDGNIARATAGEKIGTLISQPA